MVTPDNATLIVAESYGKRLTAFEGDVCTAHDVVRSKSDDPIVVANRDVLHKIGVTGGDVTRRFANAKLGPTF